MALIPLISVVLKTMFLHEFSKLISKTKDVGVQAQFCAEDLLTLTRSRKAVVASLVSPIMLIFCDVDCLNVECINSLVRYDEQDLIYDQ